jgi:SAM-dependent methyltransferase
MYSYSQSWKGGRSRKNALRISFYLLSRSFPYPPRCFGVGMYKDEVIYSRQQGIRVTHIFEPSKEAKKEIEDLCKKYGIEIIPYPISFLPEDVKGKFSGGFDCGIMMNVIQWPPINPILTLVNIYELLKKGGKILISYYVRVDPKAENKEKIIQTKEMRKIIERIRKEGKTPITYRDRNGILEVSILTRSQIKNILLDLFMSEFQHVAMKYNYL